MLKEQANNSLKDKIDLKNSLEDISHQLKTPLTSILIMLDNIIDNPEMKKSTKEEFLRDIKREISNINFFIQNILKLSKLDSNTVHFIEEEVLIKDLVKEAIKRVAPLADLKNIKLIKKGKSTKKITCDFKWQCEAVTNILKNCVEHSDIEKEVTISIEENKVYTSISIKNYGPSIPPKELPHIFERFYKGSNATKDSIGIGLSLAKTIVESANGFISVNSSDGETTFIIKYFYN